METKRDQFDRGALKPVAEAGAVCYFLGAGFSAATRYEMPVSSGFLTPELDFLDVIDGGQVKKSKLRYDRDQPDLRGLLERIEKQYGTIREQNIESVLSDLYIRAYGIGQSWERTKCVGQEDDLTISGLKRDYGLLLSYIVMKIQWIENQGLKCPKVDFWTQSLRAQDSILTLNYDTIIERQFGHRDEQDRTRKMGNAVGPSTPGYCGPPALFAPQSQEGGGVFAKLHGSIDWLACPNLECPNHPYIGSTSPWYGNRKDVELDLRCNVCSQTPEPVIIPPIGAKPFDRFPKLNVMWSHAYEALKSAWRWVFIGVSFAPSDVHLRSLLRSASRDALYFDSPDGPRGQICVVNRNYPSAEEAAGRLHESLSPHVLKAMRKGGHKTSVFESLDQYLQEVERVDANRPDVKAEREA